MHREFHVMAEKNIKLFEYVYGNRMYLNLNKKTPGAQKTPGADWSSETLKIRTFNIR